MVNGSDHWPWLMPMPAKTRIDRMKLKIGPAATVAVRAQSGAPSMVCRRSSGGISVVVSPALAEAALASPRNFT